MLQINNCRLNQKSGPLLWRLLRSNNSGTRRLFITLFLYGRLSPGAAEGRGVRGGRERERERERCRRSIWLSFKCSKAQLRLNSFAFPWISLFISPLRRWCWEEAEERCSTKENCQCHIFQNEIMPPTTSA